MNVSTPAAEPPAAGSGTGEGPTGPSAAWLPSDNPESTATLLHLMSAMLRPALLSTAVVGPLAILVAWVLAGGSGALGALFGTLLVIVSGWFTLALMRWTAAAAPVIVMAAAVMGYCAKFTAMLTLLIVLGDTTLFDVRAVGLAILASAVAWTLAELVGFVRTRVITVTPRS